MVDLSRPTDLHYVCNFIRRVKVLFCTLPVPLHMFMPMAPMALKLIVGVTIILTTTSVIPSSVFIQQDKSTILHSSSPFVYYVNICCCESRSFILFSQIKSSNNQLAFWFIIFSYVLIHSHRAFSYRKIYDVESMTATRLRAAS